MKDQWLLARIGIVACTLILGAEGVNPSTVGGAQESNPAAPAPKTEAQPSQSKCLGCHGPFDKIIAGSEKYVLPSGEKINPHRFVPHDSKKEDDIPECTHCHLVHPIDPLPAQGSVDLSKVSVKWCYEACHHEENFTPCKQCHEGGVGTATLRQEEDKGGTKHLVR
jgi:hypothetical protein